MPHLTVNSCGVRLRVAAVVVWIALAACCVAVFGFTLEALVDVLGCAVVVAVTVTDLESRIVPNRIVVPALVVALVVQTVETRASSGCSALSAPEASSCCSRSSIRRGWGWGT